MNSISGLENYQNQLSRITGLSDGKYQKLMQSLLDRFLKKPLQA